MFLSELQFSENNVILNPGKVLTITVKLTSEYLKIVFTHSTTSEYDASTFLSIDFII